MPSHSIKGFTDVAFMFTFAVFLVAFIFITPMLSSYGVPTLDIIDLGFIGGSILGVGVACAVITGLGCVAASIISSIITVFAIPPIYSVVFTAFLFTYAYIIAKLARGTG